LGGKNGKQYLHPDEKGTYYKRGKRPYSLEIHAGVKLLRGTGSHKREYEKKNTSVQGAEKTKSNTIKALIFQNARP